jgi:hypothetical protein
LEKESGEKRGQGKSRPNMIKAPNFSLLEIFHRFRGRKRGFTGFPEASLTPKSKLPSSIDFG